MNLSLVIDWKFAVALGASAIGIIFATKMDADAAERVSTQVVDAYSKSKLTGNCE